MTDFDQDQNTAPEPDDSYEMEDATLIASVTDSHQSIMSGWGTSTFEVGSRVFLFIKDQQKPIILTPQDEMLIGRGSSVHPDLNMTPFGGATKGISRIHAAFRRDEEEGALVLVDLGSTNGTFLNGQQCSPNLPYTLHDGDTIRFGKLVTHIYFK